MTQPLAMAGLSIILKLITSISDRSVDRAIGAALPTATPEDARELVELAMQRGRPEALAGAVLACDRLDPATRQRLIDSADRLERTMRDLLAAREPAAAANVLHIIVAARRGTLAYLVAELLRRGPQQTRRDAAMGLGALTDALAPRGEGDGEPPAGGGGYAPSAIDVDSLASAVRDAVRSYRFHDQPAVLRAALALLPRTAEALREAFSPPRGSPAQAVRRLMASPEGRVLSALPWLLAAPTLRNDADAALRRAAATGQWAALLARWPVLLSPVVDEALHKSARPQELLPAADKCAATPVHTGIGLCYWIAALRLPAADAAGRLAALHAHADRRVRLAALRRLLTLAAGSAQQLALPALERFCEDADEAIARTALHALVRRSRSDLAPLLMRLVNSPHESVRRIAGRWLAPLGFDRLWRAWRQLTPAQQIAAGRALIKINELFHQQLARKLESPDRKDRVRALTMITRLNQGAFFAEALIDLAHDADERIAATAVAALGSADAEAHALDDSPVVRTLEWALHHGDARVRANAVESLAKLRACRDVRRLTEMAGRDDPRPRANAIMALLDLRMVDSLAALHAMLHDGRAAQRISALWLVEHMGVLNVAEDVARLAVDDEDPGVRERAGRVIDHLIQHMGSGGARDAEHAPGHAAHVPPHDDPITASSTQRLAS